MYNIGFQQEKQHHTGEAKIDETHRAVQLETEQGNRISEQAAEVARDVIRGVGNQLIGYFAKGDG